MKVNVVAHYNNRAHEFTIQVGQGTQSIKWLALATAQCLTLRGAPHGRRRCREDGGFVVPHGAQIMPDDVRTKECAFYHPEDLLSEHLHDNDDDAPLVFHVDLVHRLPVDEYGRPVVSKWAFIAFRISEGEREERERLIEEKMGELEGVRRNREKEALRRRLEKERPQIAKMRLIMAEQLYDEEAIRETMSHEWGFIISSGILDDIVPDPEEQDCIRVFLTEKYSELSDMYKFYSAVNSGGGTHTLEYIEFNKFLCETDIFQSEDHSNVMLKIFLESHILTEKENSTTAHNIHSEIHQFEFFVTLIKIAVYKYVTLTKKKVAMLKKKGHQASIAKASTPSPFESVKALYYDFLKPCIDTKPAGAAVHASLGSDEVLLHLHEHLRDLSHLFHLYSAEVVTAEPLLLDNDDGTDCNNDNDNSSNDYTPSISGMMDIKQFGNFVNDAEFLRDTLVSSSSVDDNNNDATTTRGTTAATTTPTTTRTALLTVKDVRQIFSASQHDSVSNPEELQLVVDGGDRDGHQEQMVFSEFLEGVARLGIIKWTDPGLPYTKRIERAVEKACSVVRGRPSSAAGSTDQRRS